MPIPQVNDRIKEAPVVVLRAVFAGIGQILLTADKVRARAAEQVWTPDRAPARVPAVLPADRRLPESPRNGTMRTEPAVADRPAMHEAPVSQGPVTAEATPAAKTPPAARPTPDTKVPPATKAPSAAKPRAAKTTPQTKAPRAAKTAPAPRAAEAEPATQAPPLPGYDDLSIASVRARLRVLDAATIQEMLAYEKAHARREPVIAMLERRLAKISAG
jgi:hypothetical protein